MIDARPTAIPKKISMGGIGGVNYSLRFPDPILTEGPGRTKPIRPPLPCPGNLVVRGGSDGTRTRDLRRDRPAF